MRVLILGLLCLWGSNLIALEDEKPVKLCIIIAGKPRLNAGITWSEGLNTDANGEVTFFRSWYQKRSKGKQIRLKINWNNKDRHSKLSYRKDTLITLDYPVTIINCPFEAFRQVEAAAEAEKEKIEILSKRNKALTVDMVSLQKRIAEQVELHKESLMAHYEKWLAKQIADVQVQQPKIDQQLKDWNTLLIQLFENDVLQPDVKNEINESDSLRKGINPSIDVLEKRLPEIRHNLDSDPDSDFKSGILFDSGSDTLKPAALKDLNDFVNKKSKQLQKIIAGEVGQDIAGEGGQARKRVCILSFTGYADTTGMGKAVNKTCPLMYQDTADGNLCLSWRRAQTVQTSVIPLFNTNAGFELKAEPPVGKGRIYALADSNSRRIYSLPDSNSRRIYSLPDSNSQKTQDNWRKCTISVIYISRDIYEAYVEVNVPPANKN